MNIAVLVSGGVDSSVALQLLKEQGHTLTAFYLKIWLEDELSYLGNCPWEEDLAYVRRLCRQLQIPLEIVSLQREYADAVLAYTIAEVKRGNTPSPDLICNQQIKFGVFIERYGAFFDKIATGHYAQLGPHERTGCILKRSVDPLKDQTYFLSRLSRQQLLQSLFPIGHMTKHEVRAAAQHFMLPTAQRRDSQGICFLGKISFPQFLMHHCGVREGDLIEYETGNRVGSHNGFWFYTIGQRQGIGLGGGPWYVVTKDTKENKVYISRHYEDLAHGDLRRTFLMHSVLGNGLHAFGEGVYQLKTRHGDAEHRAQIIPAGADKYHIILEQADQGLASGQYGVFYEEEWCIGSGIIEQRSFLQEPYG